MKLKLKLLLLSMMFICLGLSFCNADGIYYKTSGDKTVVSVQYNNTQLSFDLLDTSKIYMYGNNTTDYTHDVANGSWYNIPCTENYNFVKTGPIAGVGFPAGCSLSWGGTPANYAGYIQGPCDNGQHMFKNESDLSSFVTLLSSYNSSDVSRAFNSFKNASSNTAFKMYLGFRNSTSFGFNTYGTLLYSDLSVSSSVGNTPVTAPVMCVYNEYIEPDRSRTKRRGDSLVSYYDSDNIYNQNNAYIMIAGSSSYTNGPDYNCFRIQSSNCRSSDRVSIQNPGDSVPLFLNAIPNGYSLICGLSSGSVIRNHYTSSCQFYFYDIDLGGSSCPASTINLLYNNGNSTSTINCDGTNNITINGLSTITSTNTRTPYFNINYRDQDNQLLTESYSKNNLYLSGGLFKKTYTGNNDRILTTQSNNNSIFTGYVPVFDFTGDTIVNTGNVFNNFSDNALRVLLSNIPSYIQYITIFAILVFLFSFIRRFKRKC